MADMGTKEATEKWGVTQATVQKWCREGKYHLHQHKTKRGHLGI